MDFETENMRTTVCLIGQFWWFCVNFGTIFRKGPFQLKNETFYTLYVKLVMWRISRGSTKFCKPTQGQIHERSKENAISVLLDIHVDENDCSLQ